MQPLPGVALAGGSATARVLPRVYRMCYIGVRAARWILCPDWPKCKIICRRLSSRSGCCTQQSSLVLRSTETQPFDGVICFHALHWLEASVSFRARQLWAPIWDSFLHVFLQVFGDSSFTFFKNLHLFNVSIFFIKYVSRRDSSSSFYNFQSFRMFIYLILHNCRRDSSSTFYNLHLYIYNIYICRRDSSAAAIPWLFQF